MSQCDLAISDESAGRRWTGWTILFALLGFFGVIFAVNGVMIYEALSTLSGVDTDSAYQAGRIFEQDVAAAKTQTERNWHVDAAIQSGTGVNENLEISVHDAAGVPLAGLDASVTFERPVDRRLDRKVAVYEDSAGHFHGSAALQTGQWDLVLELSRKNERLFISRNRVILK